jgi:hypothetical protein
MFYYHGIIISHDRMLEISVHLEDATVAQFNMEGLVCLSILRKYILTTAAIDNIDYNPYPTSETTSFHGTSISIFQHPTRDNKGEVREKLQINSKVEKVPELPDSFINIQPAFLLTDSSNLRELIVLFQYQLHRISQNMNGYKRSVSLNA